MAITEYPVRPFSGMKFTDLYGRQWIFDGDKNAWIFSGLKPNIPLADQSTIGFLSPELKSTIDAVPDKGGGFGIITKYDQTNTGVDGLSKILSGLIRFKSESLDITCKDVNGATITENCNIPSNSPELNLAPSIDFNFSDKFLDTFCLEVPGGPGKKGQPGEKGLTGKDGTGDGPKGIKGDDGVDATGISEIESIEVIESDDYYDTAVTSLELDTDNSILYVMYGKVKVPDNETPADKVITMPIYRSIEWSNGGSTGLSGDEFDYSITKPDTDNTDTSADCVLLAYPVDFSPTVTDPNSVQLVRSKLSDYIDKVITIYNQALTDNIEAYDLEIKEFIFKKDEEARKAMDILVKQLSDLEFNEPFEYCLSPQDNGLCGQQIASELKKYNEVTSKVNAELLRDMILAIQNQTITTFDGGTGTPTPPTPPPTVNDLFNASTAYNSSLCRFIQEILLASGYSTTSSSEFCASSKETFVGTVEAVIGSKTYVSNGAYLSAGAYILQYVNGWVFDGTKSDCGYIVGTCTTDSGLIAVLETDNHITMFPWPISNNIPFNKQDPYSVEQAYLTGPVYEQSIAIIIPDGTKAKIYVELIVGNDKESYGEVNLRVLNCAEC